MINTQFGKKTKIFQLFLIIKIIGITYFFPQIFSIAKRTDTLDRCSTVKLPVNSQLNSERILYPTLCKQQRMLSEICTWPNKYFYENSRMEIVPIVRPKRSPFRQYTVFQVNTIEDIEIEFVRQKLELFCERRIKEGGCSIDIESKSNR